jgi:prepilin-type N-terminal cleavage/methylation domain-containing protein
MLPICQLNHTASKRARALFCHEDDGFTLIEMVVAVAVFAVLLVGVVGLISMMGRSVKASREQTVLASLAANYLEVVRNLPYSEVGTVSGNPAGSLPDQDNAITATIENANYSIYYEVTYVDDPADGTITAGTDPSANDYKQVKMYIQNETTGVVRAFSTNVTPQGLEGTVNAGALSIKVFDAQGEPVAGASVAITNIAGTLSLNRSTDASGNWIEVGLPAGVNQYHVVVTKDGYSTDQTYPITGTNPNPVKPDPTISNGLVTQVSFAIDTVSSLTIRTLDSSCAALGSVNVNVVGAKLIGTAPDVLKYDADSTSAGGQIALTDLEWDTYAPLLKTGQSLMVVGTSPIQEISVLPGASQTFTMILGSQTANSLLVIVKDSATGNAIEGATVDLHQGGGTPTDYSGTTGGSVWSQSDWSGGSGQDTFTNPNRYFSDDGNIDAATLPTGLRLKKVGSDYVASGEMTSSTFDTGAASNFTTLTWQPTSQDPATAVKFQIASNNDNATWNFVGPDGTAATFYTVSGTNISTIHDGDRYIRYKVFLSTTADDKTPVLTSASVNYVSGCFTPGQVNFGGLTGGNNYDLTVTMPGYSDFTASSLSIAGNQTIEVLMSP